MMFSEHAEPIPAARVAQISSFDFCSSVQTPNPRINAREDLRLTSGDLAHLFLGAKSHSV